MIDYEQKQITQTKQFAKSIQCDVCGKTINYNDETFEQYKAYNFISITKSFGYGSEIGDGEQLKLDICEDCLIEKFGLDFLVKHSKDESEW